LFFGGQCFDFASELLFLIDSINLLFFYLFCCFSQIFYHACFTMSLFVFEFNVIFRIFFHTLCYHSGKIQCCISQYFMSISSYNIEFLIIVRKILHCDCCLIDTNILTSSMMDDNFDWLQFIIESWFLLLNNYFMLSLMFVKVDSQLYRHDTLYICTDQSFTIKWGLLNFCLMLAKALFSILALKSPLLFDFWRYTFNYFVEFLVKSVLCYILANRDHTRVGARISSAKRVRLKRDF